MTSSYIMVHYSFVPACMSCHICDIFTPSPSLSQQNMPRNLATRLIEIHLGTFLPQCVTALPETHAFLITHICHPLLVLALPHPCDDRTSGERSAPRLPQICPFH
jgi:hypothetical protein